MYTIYKHTNNITGKCYVGLTKRTTETRFKEHLVDAYRPRDGKLLTNAFYNAIRKYGKEVWRSTDLEVDLSYREANQQEAYWVNRLDSYHNGYNSTLGGDHQFNPQKVIRGKDHYAYDSNIYTFFHKENNHYVGTKQEFLSHIGLPYEKPFTGGVNNVVSGKSYSYMGWHIEPTCNLSTVKFRKHKEAQDRLKAANLRSFRKKFMKPILRVKPTKIIKNQLTPLDKLIKAAKVQRRNELRTKKPKRMKFGSKEYREACSKRFSGKNNPIYGTVRPQQVKDAVSKRRRGEADPTLRNWYHIEGRVEENIQTLLLRDKYPELLISHLKRVTDGKNQQHKGWKITPWQQK